MHLSFPPKAPRALKMGLYSTVGLFTRVEGFCPLKRKSGKSGKLLEAFHLQEACRSMSSYSTVQFAQSSRMIDAEPVAAAAPVARQQPGADLRGCRRRRPAPACARRRASLQWPPPRPRARAPDAPRDRCGRSRGEQMPDLEVRARGPRALLRGARRRRRRYLESAFRCFMKGTMMMLFAEHYTSHERCLVQSHVYTNCRAILKEVSLRSSLGGRSTATWCGLAPSCMGDNQ